MSISDFTSLAGRFAQIIDDLCHAVPKFIAQDRTAGPLIILIFNHLRRLGRQFAGLAARTQAGTLPAPRRRSTVLRVGLTRAPGLLPTGFAWLGNLMPETRVYGCRLQQLVLNDPEMAALIAACPQAGRIVRSILWMTTQRPVPAILRVSRPRLASASSRPVRKGPGEELLRQKAKGSRRLDKPAPLPRGGGQAQVAVPSLKEIRFWSQPRGKLRSTAGPLQKR